MLIYSLLRNTLAELDNHQVPYMVSGSMALNAYTVPRMSYDIDIVIELEEEKLGKFIDIFREGFYVNANTVREEVERKGMFNVIDNSTGIKIDFILKKESEFRELEFSRRVRRVIADNIEGWIVSPEDLVISKIAWIQQLKSEKQISDIECLLSIENIDKNYILEWCSKLKLNTYEIFES